MFNFLTDYTCITWYGTVYAVHKTLRGLLSLNCLNQVKSYNLFKKLTYSLNITNLVEMIFICSYDTYKKNGKEEVVFYRK